MLSDQNVGVARIHGLNQAALMYTFWGQNRKATTTGTKLVCVHVCGLSVTDGPVRMNA